MQVLVQVYVGVGQGVGVGVGVYFVPFCLVMFVVGPWIAWSELSTPSVTVRDRDPLRVRHYLGDLTHGFFEGDQQQVRQAWCRRAPLVSCTRRRMRRRMRGVGALPRAK